MIGTEIDVLLSNRKTISSPEGKFESVLFWEWLYRLKNLLVGVIAIAISMLHILTSNLSVEFEKLSLYWSWFSEELGYVFLSSLLDADADRERGIEGSRFEVWKNLKYCRFPELDLEIERWPLFLKEET